MMIATYSNTRTAYEVYVNGELGLQKGFVVAYRAGLVMGFFLVAIGLLVLDLLIIIYSSMYADAFSR